MSFFRNQDTLVLSYEACKSLHIADAEVYEFVAEGILHNRVTHLSSCLVAALVKGEKGLRDRD